MTNASIEIAYAVHTASCTFLLDAEGICRRVVMAPTNKRRDVSKTASRCVGAQYVASLDASVPGCLVEMPRTGASLLFARTDERGRVTLVRSGIVTRFETKRAEDPFSRTSDEDAVSTSAPEVAPRATRLPRKPSSFKDPYVDSNERTQPIQALHSRDLIPVTEDLKTAEYSSNTAGQRGTLPSPVRSTPLRTVRDPRVELAFSAGDTIENDAYARSAPHRRAEPSTAKRPSRHGRVSEPAVTTRYPQDKVATRRTGER